MPGPHPPSELVLFTLHFLGGSAGTWSEMARALPPGLHHHSIDLPGFGDNAAHQGHSVAAMADHVAAAIDEVAPARYLLAGHSMGAKVVTVLARRAEDRPVAGRALAGLLLVAGSPPSPEPMGDERRREMLSWFAGTDDQHRAQADRFLRGALGAPLAAAPHERAVADVLRAHPDAWRAWLTAGSNEDLSDLVGVLATPALLVAGGNDADLGLAAQERLMAPHFRDVRIEVMDGAGHLLPLERPVELAAMIAEFAGDLRTSGAPGPGERQ